MSKVRFQESVVEKCVQCKFQYPTTEIDKYWRISDVPPCLLDGCLVKAVETRVSNFSVERVECWWVGPGIRGVLGADLATELKVK